MKLNVGVIGIGEDWETLHRPALKSLSDRFEVKGVCSDIAIKSRNVANDFNATQFDGFRALIQREDIDAVLCLGRDWVGALPLLAACDFGKAIYSSTTLDMDPTRAGQIKQRVEESGVAFMAEFARRHTPATIRLQELIATRLGKPKMIFCTERMTQRKATTSESLMRGCNDDGKLMLELIDWCSYIIGESPSSVQGIRHEYESGSHLPESNSSSELSGDSVSEFKLLSLGFEDEKGKASANAQIRMARLMPEDWKDAISFRRPAKVQVSCERGVAYIDSPTTIIWFDEGGQHTESLEADRPVGEQLLTLFHRAVTSLIRKTNDIEDAYRARLIVDRAYESFETSRAIRLA